jgi:hypothetical protein
MQIHVDHPHPSNPVLDFLVSPIHPNLLFVINCVISILPIIYFIRYYHRTYDKLEKFFWVPVPLMLTIGLYLIGATAWIWLIVIIGFAFFVTAFVWRSDLKSRED